MASSILLGGVFASGRAQVMTGLLLRISEPSLQATLAVLKVVALSVRYPRLDPSEPER